MWRYVLRMAALSLVPTILLAMSMAGVGLLSEEDAPKFRGSPEAIFFGIVVISPVLETLIMAVIFRVLSLFTRNALWLAIMSCVIWGMLHSLAAPMWGFVVVWAFFVFSCAFLAWRQRSWLYAIVVTTSIHVLHNLPSALVFLFAMPAAEAEPHPEPPPVRIIRPAAVIPVSDGKSQPLETATAASPPSGCTRIAHAREHSGPTLGRRRREDAAGCSPRIRPLGDAVLRDHGRDRQHEDSRQLT